MAKGSRKWWVVLGVGLGLTGCMVWVHPTKGEQQFHEDSAFCDAQAGQAAAGYGGTRDPYGLAATNQSLARDSVFKSCMYGKGWQRVRS